MACEYCGNLSGKTDKYGNCISCGAPMRDGAPKMIIKDLPLYWRDRGLTNSTLIAQTGGIIVLDDDLNHFRMEQNRG